MRREQYISIYIKTSKFDQERSSVESEKLVGARKGNKMAHRDPEIEKVIELEEGQSTHFAREYDGGL